jgi:hypothetical protein
VAFSGLHFAVGMTAGLAVTTRPFLHAWRAGLPVSSPAGRWLLAGWAAGTWAIVPSLLRWCGAPDGLCDGAWTNVFFLHPAIDYWGAGTQKIGIVWMAFLLALQYLVLLAAIRRCTRRLNLESR